MTAIIAGKLPASFIPVEFSLPPQRRPSTASSSSTTSSDRSTYDLVQCLEPSYRYLLCRPGNGVISPPHSASSTSTSVTSEPGVGAPASSPVNIGTTDQNSVIDGSEDRKVRRKGKAYRSPPLEPASQHPRPAVPTGSTSNTSTSSTATQPLPGMVAEPLAYVGTINYGFILNACQSISQTHDGSPNRSPPRNGDHSSQRHSSSAKTSKGKSGGAKSSARLWDWKGKGNDRSAKEPLKQKKIVANGTSQTSRAKNVREANEESRPRSKRPTRNASQQRQQRNKSSEPAVVSKKTSPPTATSAPLTRNNSAAGSTQVANDTSGAKHSSSLVPPPSVHQAHLHPPPSPLRQSAIPARLSDKSHASKGKAGDSMAVDTSMTRSSSHGVAASEAVVHATRGSKRRQSSAGPTSAAGEDEEDVSKRLRRALASSIPLAGSPLLPPASPKRAARTVRPATRYATRSAPNSPPEAASDSFPDGVVDLTRLHPAVNHVGRAALRRTLSHDALSEEPDSSRAREDAETAAQSRSRRDVSLPKNLRDYQTGIHA